MKKQCLDDEVSLKAIAFDSSASNLVASCLQGLGASICSNYLNNLL